MHQAKEPEAAEFNCCIVGKVADHAHGYSYCSTVRMSHEDDLTGMLLRTSPHD